MNILQVYEIGPLHGECVDGIGVCIMEVSKKLVELGHDVTFLTGQTYPPSPPRENIAGVDIVRSSCLGLMKRTWSRVQLKPARQLAFLPTALSRCKRFDVCNGHLYASGIVAWLLAKRMGGAAVNTIHGPHHQAWSTIEGVWWKRRAFSTGERLMTPLLARLTALQIHTAQYSLELAVRWGAPRGKLVTVYNGVDIESFNSHAAPAFNSELPIIFTARRLVRKNGLDVLLQAFEHVVKDTDAKLVIAGEGPEGSCLEGLARTLGVGGKVVFLGGIPHNSIPAYLASAAIAVLPSHIEATSLFALEAMAMEKPVVATNVGGIPEIISDGVTGVLVEHGDPEALAYAVLKLLNDADYRGALGREARRRVLSEHTWDSIARQYLNIFIKAADNG